MDRKGVLGNIATAFAVIIPVVVIMGIFLALVTYYGHSLQNKSISGAKVSNTFLLSQDIEVIDGQLIDIRPKNYDDYTGRFFFQKSYRITDSLRHEDLSSKILFINNSHYTKTTIFQGTVAAMQQESEFSFQRKVLEDGLIEFLKNDNSFSSSCLVVVMSKEGYIPKIALLKDSSGVRPLITPSSTGVEVADSSFSYNLYDSYLRDSSFSLDINGKPASISTYYGPCLGVNDV